MEKKTEKQITDGLRRVCGQLDNLNDEMKLREELERREVYKRTAAQLLMYRLNTSTSSITQCMDWAIEHAQRFSHKVMENINGEPNAKDPLSDYADTEIIQEVCDRGLVADVLFTNEELVESYGYVRKSDTEF